MSLRGSVDHQSRGNRRKGAPREVNLRDLTVEYRGLAYDVLSNA